MRWRVRKRGAWYGCYGLLVLAQGLWGALSPTPSPLPGAVLGWREFANPLDPAWDRVENNDLGRLQERLLHLTQTGEKGCLEEVVPFIIFMAWGLHHQEVLQEGQGLPPAWLAKVEAWYVALESKAERQAFEKRLRIQSTRGMLEHQARLFSQQDIPDFLPALSLGDSAKAERVLAFAWVTLDCLEVNFVAPDVVDQAIQELHPPEVWPKELSDMIACYSGLLLCPTWAFQEDAQGYTPVDYLPAWSPLRPLLIAHGMQARSPIPQDPLQRKILFYLRQVHRQAGAFMRSQTAWDQWWDAQVYNWWATGLGRSTLAQKILQVIGYIYLMFFAISLILCIFGLVKAFFVGAPGLVARLLSRLGLGKYEALLEIAKRLSELTYYLFLNAELLQGLFSILLAIFCYLSILFDRFLFSYPLYYLSFDSPSSCLKHMVLGTLFGYLFWAPIKAGFDLVWKHLFPVKKKPKPLKAPAPPRASQEDKTPTRPACLLAEEPTLFFYICAFISVPCSGTSAWKKRALLRWPGSATTPPRYSWILRLTGKPCLKKRPLERSSQPLKGFAWRGSFP